MNAKKFVNLTKFLLAGALVLGMTACSSDDNIPKGGNENNKVNTYMTVSLTGNSLQRTAINGNSTLPSTNETGSDEENAINNLTIYLINSNGIVAKIQKVPDATTDPTVTLANETENETGVETTGKSTTAFKVPVGTYKIYVVANPGGAFNSVSEGTTTETDLKALTNTTALTPTDYAKVGTDAASSSFLMTNAINYNGDEAEIPSVTVTAGNTVTNPAKAAPIHVDRMAAKIKMKDAMNTNNNNVFTTLLQNNTPTPITIIDKDGTNGHTTININLIGYSLINEYNKAHLYQTWDPSSTSTSEFKQLLYTPNYLTSYNYPQSADYSNQKDAFSTRTADATNKISNFSDLETNNTIPTFKNFKTPSYCLENNAYHTYLNDTKYTKNDWNVTGVLFKAQAVTTGTTGTTGVTFYGYNGEYFKDLSDIQEKYPNIFRYYYSSGSRIDSYDATKTATDNQSATLTAAKSLAAKVLRVRYGIMVYEDGNMYYTYYIKDKNYLEKQGSDTNGDIWTNYYAVMRNSIYQLNVTSLKRIGDDIPFGWVPTNGTTPIDADNASMEVELMVNQWVLNAYDINL